MLRYLVGLCAGAAVLLSLASAASAQSRREVNAFVFGNSLIHHLTDTSETTVPYWLDQMADAGGHGFAVDGRWGFMPEFSRDLPPEPNWTFDGVDRVWTNPRFAFRRVPFDTVILAPANFIQYQSPDSAYEGNNPNGDTPLGATGRVIDWTASQARGARFFVYEGWAEMASVVAYPPNAAGLADYWEANTGAYHQWYVDYVAALQFERPNLDITLIPVASILADVMQNTALSDLAATDLFSDDAPHGTANTYFLAAMITYSSLYAGPAPRLDEIPETIHPLIADNYDALSNRIWQSFSGAIIPDGAVAEIPETGLVDPSLAMGLNGIADWSTQQPFINVMKTARPWIGHLPGQWGGWDVNRLRDEGYLDANGWPLGVPDGVEAIEAFVLTNQAPGGTSIAGRYVVTWDGQGDIQITGAALDVDREGDVITFGFRPGEELVAVRIEDVDPEDPIRNIAIVREDLVPFHQAGAIFNPDWIKRIENLRMVRFMDWMMTNGSPQTTWADRPQPQDFSYVWRGSPVEVMVELSNQIGADPWFTLPHMADDAYVRAFATTVLNTLDSDLVVHAEWSNEVWNFIFPQAVWAREQAVELWGEDVPDGWMQYAGLRAAQVADIWSEVYAGHEDQLLRMVATHSGWFGLEEALLEAELVVRDGFARPADSFDGYAITGYFGFEIGDDEMTEQLRAWVDAGTADAEVTQMLREGSFKELTDDVFPYQASVAERYGYELHMYEGGTHVAGHGLQSQDDVLTAFYNTYNYSPHMAGLYADLLAAWSENAQGPFNAFVDVSAPSQFGSWGALRHLDDVNPRWSTMQAYNALPFGSDRAPEAFLNGVTRDGTDSGDTLQGTPQGDILIGRDGDDTILPGLGTNRMHGGDGRDTVRVPGVAADYQQGWLGDDTLILISEESVHYITAVEVLEFDGAAGDTQSLELPEE